MFGADTATIVQVIGVTVYSILEYWLGRTEKVQAASMIELVINGALSALSKKEKSE